MQFLLCLPPLYLSPLSLFSFSPFFLLFFPLSYFFLIPLSFLCILSPILSSSMLLYSLLYYNVFLILSFMFHKFSRLQYALLLPPIDLEQREIDKIR
jgi:hypothetical protein